MSIYKPIKYTLVALLGANIPIKSCRFYPTCSQYAHDACLAHGYAKGSLLALKRLLRCHPWGPAGIDPVPESRL